MKHRLKKSKVKLTWSADEGWLMASRIDVLSVFSLIITVYLSVCVYKKSLICPDGISATFGQEDIATTVETYTFSALWLQKHERNFGYRRSTTRKITLVLLLLMFGDIESCPGSQEESLNGFMKSRGLKVFHQNVRGLFTNFVHVKELLDCHKGMDILSLSETHIINNQYDDNDDLFAIDGYKFIK